MTVPLLALADAGIAIDGDFLERAADSPSTLGVLVGYAAGKPLGVVGTAWLSRGDCDRRSAGAPSQAQAQAVAAPAARRRASSRRAGGTGLGGRRRSGRVLADARPAARAPGQAADGRSGVVRRPTRALDVARFTEDLRGHVAAKRIAQGRGGRGPGPRVRHAHVLRQRAPPPRRVRHGHSVAVRAAGGRAKLAAA